MFLCVKNKKNKSLSVLKHVGKQYSGNLFPGCKHTKTLQCTHARASFTVEAAMVVPLFLFAAALVLNLFPAIKAQVQVTAAMQYASRKMAVTFTGDQEILQSAWAVAKGKTLMKQYFSDHELDESNIKGGLSGISLLGSECMDDYVTLRASYEMELPISFANISSFPIRQCVRTKKWTGAQEDGAGEMSESDYVYITPNGSAYHTTLSCSYLNLSIQSVTVSSLGSLRSKDGSIYYPCGCYDGGTTAYITSYGTEYHSNLNCSELKRTIIKVSKEEIGSRHACSKCAK